MLSDGFRQYEGEIAEFVYERLGCKHSDRAYWVCRWPLFHCLGCNRRCTPKNAEGFQVPLVTSAPPKRRYNVTPDELVASKSLLRVDEVAFCLAVSERHVRKLIDEGVLVRHQRNPVRVTAESVRDEMGRVDW